MQIRLKGLPASPGLAFGTVKVVGAGKGRHDIGADSVIVTRDARSNLAPSMRRAIALVCAVDAGLDGLLALARDWQIPAVVGIGCAIAELQDGMPVAVNGTAGTVVVDAMRARPAVMSADSQAARRESGQTGGTA